MRLEGGQNGLSREGEKELESVMLLPECSLDCWGMGRGCLEVGKTAGLGWGDGELERVTLLSEWL